MKPAMNKFEFEGDFLDRLTPVEVKVLALHEIAHFNALIGRMPYEHGEYGHELIFYGLFQKEGISYDEVNTAIQSIHVKWEAYNG